MRVFLLSFFFIIWTNLFLYSYEETPYYLNNGEVRSSFGVDSFFLSNYNLNFSYFSFDYGVNDRFLIGFRLPYIFFNSFLGEGIIGDVELNAKFLLERDFFELWRFSFLTFIKFPTGVVKEDSYKFIMGNRYSFFPFSRGTFGFYPGFNFSYYLKPFMLWLNLLYCVDNYSDEGIVSFNPGFDRLKLSLNSDVEIELFKFNETIFLYLPEVSLSYTYNISKDVLYPDSLEVYLENSLKTGKFFKFSLGFLLPIIFEKKIYDYSLWIKVSFWF
ncbi:MAG: hypothetical protein N2258_07180 [Brevinematales bacterium]|nr:hypothetical protein [Brevinematales bacterium]